MTHWSEGEILQPIDVFLILQWWCKSSGNSFCVLGQQPRNCCVTAMRMSSVFESLDSVASYSVTANLTFQCSCGDSDVCILMLKPSAFSKVWYWKWLISFEKKFCFTATATPQIEDFICYFISYEGLHFLVQYQRKFLSWKTEIFLLGKECK